MRVLSKGAKHINTRWEPAANIGCPVTWQRTHIVHRLRASTTKWVLMWNECVRVCSCVRLWMSRVYVAVKRFLHVLPAAAPSTCSHARVRLSWLHSQHRVAHLETSASLNVEPKRRLDTKCKNGQSFDWRWLKSAFCFETVCCRLSIECLYHV